jgi:hypothetical protein
VGIIVGKLDALHIAQATGDLPQNVNFVVSVVGVERFLSREGVPIVPAASPAAPVGEELNEYVVLIECHPP